MGGADILVCNGWMSARRARLSESRHKFAAVHVAGLGWMSTSTTPPATADRNVRPTKRQTHRYVRGRGICSQSKKN